jgi:hypothetical protein
MLDSIVASKVETSTREDAAAQVEFFKRLSEALLKSGASSQDSDMLDFNKSNPYESFEAPVKNIDWARQGNSD